MDSEQRGDARLAVIVVLVALMLGFLAGRVWATQLDEYAHTEPCMHFDLTWKIIEEEGDFYRIGKSGCYNGLVTKNEWADIVSGDSTTI